MWVQKLSLVLHVEESWLFRCLLTLMLEGQWLKCFEHVQLNFIFKRLALVCECGVTHSYLYTGTYSHIKMTQVKNPSGFCYSVWPYTPVCGSYGLLQHTGDQFQVTSQCLAAEEIRAFLILNIYVFDLKKKKSSSKIIGQIPIFTPSCCAASSCWPLLLFIALFCFLSSSISLLHFLAVIYMILQNKELNELNSWTAISVFVKKNVAVVYDLYLFCVALKQSWFFRCYLCASKLALQM